MKEFKGTPGPWYVGCGTAIYNAPCDEASRKQVYVSETMSIEETQDVIIANAKLIAAAPELLEALQNILNAYGEVGAANFWSINESPEGIKARATIAKALGE